MKGRPANASVRSASFLRSLCGLFSDPQICSVVSEGQIRNMKAAEMKADRAVKGDTKYAKPLRYLQIRAHKPRRRYECVNSYHHECGAVGGDQSGGGVQICGTDGAGLFVGRREVARCAQLGRVGSILGSVELPRLRPERRGMCVSARRY